MKTDSTLRFYDTDAQTTAATYEHVPFEAMLSAIAPHLPDSGRLLEVGAGSGRDAAYWLAQGYDVTAIDGSAGMMAEALRRHPELHGRMIPHVLPHRLPFVDACFDVVTSMAVIMHLSHEDLWSVFADLSRVLAPDGVLAYSVNTERSGLDANGNDRRGRHFTCLSADAWEVLHAAAGLQTTFRQENDDITAREGIRWVTFAARKPIT